jgi:hypothetical protein
MKQALGFAFLAAMASVTASGSVIQLTLANDTLSATAGSTVTFLASATNTAGVTENLNSDSFTPLPLTFDDSPFLNNWPLSLPAGGSFGAPDALFNVTIPIGTAANSYTGMFEILGGPGAAAMDVLAVVDYTVNVTAAAPEPSTVFLIGGTLGLAALFSRRRIFKGINEASQAIGLGRIDNLDWHG